MGEWTHPQALSASLIPLGGVEETGEAAARTARARIAVKVFILGKGWSAESGRWEEAVGGWVGSELKLVCLDADGELERGVERCLYRHFGDVVDGFEIIVCAC